jgi:hypothetical protein
MQFVVSKLIVAGSVALLFGGMIAMIGPGAQALPAYAQQTGFDCHGCHINPTGGGALNEAGQKFKDNGHRLPDRK